MAGLSDLLRALMAALLLAAMPAAMASSLSSSWQRQLPHTAMPEAFKKLASPLSMTLAENYAGLLKKGSVQASKDQNFCSSAEIYCQKAATIIGRPQPRVCIPPFFFYEYNVLRCNRGTGTGAGMGASALEAPTTIFFSEDTLAVGKPAQLPNTSNDLKGLKFLPYSLAKALPDVGTNSLAELVSFYGVTEGSDMERDMQDAATYCEFKSVHEVKACLTSGEAMVSFVSETVGHNVIAIAPPAIAAQKATVLDMVVSSAGIKVAACHDMKFPSLLYSCHMTQSSQVMDVALKLADGDIVHLPAICHLDTRYWNPSHVAFKALNAKPGEIGVCHWFPENSFIFMENGN